MLRMMKCPKCGYEWTLRIEAPKKCPFCGFRLSKAPRKTLEAGK